MVIKKMLDRSKNTKFSNKNEIVVLSGDPGLVSFTISITKFYKGQPFKAELLHQQLIKDVITNLGYKEKIERRKKTAKRKKVIKIIHEPYDIQLRKFVNTVNELMTTYNPDMIVFERFQNRGIPGHIIECVSAMNAIWSLQAYNKNIPCRFILASDWKLAFKRYHGIKIDDSMHRIGKKLKVLPHQIDSYCIGLYASGIENPFEGMQCKEHRNELLKNMKAFVNTQI